MDRKPLIGITPGLISDKNKLSIARGYADGINKAGGLAVVLPLTSDEGMLMEFIDRLDGFLLSGGPDIDARYFHEVNYIYNGEISPLRDSMELFLAGNAMAKGKPIFGICRGIQVLNVALGGTIYQDIHSQIKDRELLKHSQEAPDWYPVHDVCVDKDTRLWNCYNKDKLCVNSFHHQAVKALGGGLKPAAFSADGIIEAVEYEGDVFAVGVQWHPELMWQEDPEVLKLFEAFVEAGKR